MVCASRRLFEDHREQRKESEHPCQQKGQIKKRLFDAYWTYFAPMRQKREELAADPDYVNRVLREGAEKARALADPVLERVKRAMGLG